MKASHAAAGSGWAVEPAPALPGRNEAFSARKQALPPVRTDWHAHEDVVRYARVTDAAAANLDRSPTTDPDGKPHREAAGIVLQSNDGRSVLVGLRAEWLEFGGTWSIPGGLLDPGETPLVAAVRETCEELGIDLDTFADAVRDIRLLDRSWKDGRGGWYTTFIAECDLRLEEILLDSETARVLWVPRRYLRGLDLHPGFARTLGVKGGKGGKRR